jgi:hypothetical protein
MGVGPFNTEAHIETAIEAVGAIVDFRKKIARDVRAEKG